MMKISELKPEQRGVNIVVKVTEILGIREFSESGKKRWVATAIAEDDTGKIKLAVWEGDIKEIKVGDKIKITNGFVNEFQGEMQLTAGKYGKIELVN